MKVAVIGAGIIGCAIAYELSKNHSVTVFEKRKDVGAGTTSAAGGILMYNTLIERPKEWHRMASQAIKYHRKLEAELFPFWHWSGRTEISNLKTEIKRIQQKFESEVRSGRKVIWRSKEHNRREFGLEDFEGYTTEDEGWVDPVKLSAILFEESKKRGAKFLFGKVVETISQAIVTCNDGSEFHADVVVVAAGIETVSLNMDIAIPSIIPIKGQSMLFRDAQMPFKDILYFNGVWCLQRPEGFFVGATVEETPVAGTTLQIVPLLHQVIQAFPNLARYQLKDIEFYTGFRPKCEDQIPIIRKEGKIIWAIGHQNNGILLAPYTASVVAKLL